ncbi:MAG: hypothetical protein ACREE3_00700 [Stellaceae bacterium]
MANLAERVGDELGVLSCSTPVHLVPRFIDKTIFYPIWHPKASLDISLKREQEVGPEVGPDFFSAILAGRRPKK